MKKHELIENEIYICNTITYGIYLMKAVGDLISCCNAIQITNNYYVKNCTFKRDSNIHKAFTFKLATPEEKHWLNNCIKEDKFITFEEAVKTFVPEYVECIKKAPYNFYGEVGTVYKIINLNYKKSDYILEGSHSGSTDRRRFKPSTKEAYDAQFVVKQLKTPKDKILEYCRKNNNLIKKVQCSEGGVYQLDDKITVFTKDSSNKGKLLTIKSFRWNNDNSAICAITETHTPNGISLNKIELYLEPKKLLFKKCYKN